METKILYLDGELSKFRTKAASRKTKVEELELIRNEKPPDFSTEQEKENIMIGNDDKMYAEVLSLRATNITLCVRFRESDASNADDREGEC